MLKLYLFIALNLIISFGYMIEHDDECEKGYYIENQCLEYCPSGFEIHEMKCLLRDPLIFESTFGNDSLGC